MGDYDIQTILLSKCLDSRDRNNSNKNVTKAVTQNLLGSYRCNIEEILLGNGINEIILLWVIK